LSAHPKAAVTVEGQDLNFHLAAVKRGGDERPEDTIHQFSQASPGTRREQANPERSIWPRCQGTYAVVGIGLQSFDRIRLGNCSFSPVGNDPLSTKPKAAFAIWQQGIPAGVNRHSVGFSKALEGTGGDMAERRIETITRSQDPQ
jgi:hypothetical protein